MTVSLGVLVTLFGGFQGAPRGELIFEPGSEGLSEVVLASNVSGHCSGTLNMAVAGVSAHTGRASASWLVKVVTDGTIDLLVDTRQGYAREGSAVSGGGRKRLVVTPGETVELELPEEVLARLPADVRPHAFGLRVTAERLW